MLTELLAAGLRLLCFCDGGWAWATGGGSVTSQAGGHPLEPLGDLNVHASDERPARSRLSEWPSGQSGPQVPGR